MIPLDPGTGDRVVPIVRFQSPVMRNHAGLALALLALPIAAAAQDALPARAKRAFRRLPLPPPARLARRLETRLPKGIVIESAPFDALIARELEPFQEQLALRRSVLDELLRDGSAGAQRLVRTAGKTLDRDRAELLRRIGKIEGAYAGVYNRGYMQSSNKTHTTRRLAAVLIPVYRTLLLNGETLAARAATPRTKEGLREALLHDPRARARARALGALMAFPLKEVKDAAVAALEDSAWNVRALAVAICRRGGLIEASDALVAALAKERGRLRKDIDDTLHELTKAQFFGDLALWKRWLEDNRERIRKEAGDRAVSGLYDQPLGLPATWKRDAADNTGEQKRKGRTSAFYGIPTVSRRVLFVIDISRSMDSPAQARPHESGRQPGSAYAEPKGDAKLDIARWQLHRAVEALPTDAVFNILVYSESYTLWHAGMASAKKSSKAKAHKFIDGLVANGVTNICDSLDKAFDVAGFGASRADQKARATAGSRDPGPAADTLYLLSDGDPNRGRITDLEALLDDVVARDPVGGLVIHTIGIGEAAGSSFLKALAERTGGRYVGYR